MGHAAQANVIFLCGHYLWTFCVDIICGHYLWTFCLDIICGHSVWTLSWTLSSVHLCHIDTYHFQALTYPTQICIATQLGY